LSRENGYLQDMGNTKVSAGKGGSGDLVGIGGT